MCCSVEEGVHDCSGPQCHSQRSTVAQHLHRFCAVKVIISLFNFSVHTTIRRRTLNFRRLFGQSHLCVYVDGTQRLTVNMRLPPVNEVFSSLSICAPPVKSRTDLHGKAEFFPSSLPRKKNASDVRSSAVGLVQHVPNYFSLPISLTSLKSATGDQHSGKYLKFIDLKPTPSVKQCFLHRSWGEERSIRYSGFYLGQAHLPAWPDWNLCLIPRSIDLAARPDFP